MTRQLRGPEELRDLLGIPFNDEQLAAISAPLEPTLVVAGAGSGKTTVMAARVVWLVGTGQVAPERVLGLTFTNKAAAELAGRVRTALTATGYLPAYGASAEPVGLEADAEEAGGEPTVATYHAFAGRLVRDHGLRVGVEPDSALIGDATRFLLARRAQRDAVFDPTVFTVLPAAIAQRVLALAAEMAEHRVTPAALRAYDDELVAAVDAAPSSTAETRAVADAARRRQELSKLVEAFTQAKRDRDLVDFGDQIALAAQIALEHPAVADVLRADFDVVLLDEYQDTSIAQRDLLLGLFGGGFPVTAVGDPFQAIYEWRGASVANIEGFTRDFAQPSGEPARTYSLPVNQRSGGRVLDLANAISQPLREAADASGAPVEPLRAPLGREGAGRLRAGLFETYADEVGFVADEVQAAHERGTPWHEIAVLVRRTSDIAAIYERLTEAGVPVEVVGLAGLLAVPGVTDVVATLQLLHDPVANPALLRLLSGARWRIGPRDLFLLGRRASELARFGEGGRLAAAAAADEEDAAIAGGLQAALEEAVAGVDPAEVVSLLDALESPGALPYSQEARERFAALAAELAALRLQATESLPDLVHLVTTTIGLDVEVRAGPVATAAARADALAAFTAVASDFRDIEGEATLASFLSFLEVARDEESGLEAPTPVVGDSVKLLTVHRAKGLEWDVVVLPCLVNTVFPSSRGRPKFTRLEEALPVDLRGDRARLPRLEEMSKAGIAAYGAACKDNELSEERRLGYVAATRARDLVIASAHWWGPTQINKRGPSEMFEAVVACCEAGGGEVISMALEPPEDVENPALDDANVARVVWPIEPEPAAEERRQWAAAAVRERMGGDGSAAGSDLTHELTGEEQELVAGWDRDLDLLVAELRRTAARATRDVALPTSLSATQMLALRERPDELARDIARPMPSPPRPAARRGSRFHAWLEGRSGERPLLGPLDVPGAGDAEITDDADLIELQEAFEAGPWADRVPVAQEVAFALVLGGRVIRGRIDAVFAAPPGGEAAYEVVDWKTNRRHDADPLQLAIYRVAWAELAGVPEEAVIAAFAYIRDGAVVTPADLPGRAELERILRPE